MGEVAGDSRFPSLAGQDRGPFGSWLQRCKMQKSGKAVSFSRTVSLPRPILLHRHNHAKLSLKKKAYRRGQAFEIEIKPFTGEKKKGK